MVDSSGQEESDTSKNESDEKRIKILIALISLASYFMIHLIDITSRHFAVAFNIPLIYIGIYFDKLYSMRCFLNVLGSLVEFIIYQIGGGDRGSDTGLKVRKYVSTSFFIILFIVRTFFFVILFFSSQLSYHVYLVLSFEALIHGFYDDSNLSLAAGYVPLISLFYNLCRVVIVGIQFVLDRFWYAKPLLMIKIQAWICATLTAISSGWWIYLNFYDPSFYGQNEKKSIVPSESSTRDGLDNAISPFIMLLAASMTKDFLTPGTLPYTLLERDKCHMINMAIPIQYLLATSTYFIIDHLGYFKRWSIYYNGFLLLIIPMAIIFVYSLMAIHTQIPSARAIINSRPRVMAMTLILVLSAGYLESLNYIAVAKYAYNGNPYGYTVQGINNAFHMIVVCLFTRLSVAYGEIRIGLGYHLPKFRPIHKMSKSNLAFYIIKQTFKRYLYGIKKELKFDIKEYL